jgi:hypothetical protein
MAKLIRCLALSLIVICFTDSLALGGPVDLIQQAQVEAAFIYQFRNYVTWPNETGTDDSRDFIISIVGNEKGLLQELEKLAKVKKMKNRSIAVRAVETVAKLSKSDIVIVGSNELELLQGVIRKVKGEHTLIVSHSSEFAKKGAMINFFLEDDRLRFEINLNAIKKENLQVGSQLLNLARVINE